MKKIFKKILLISTMIGVFMVASNIFAATEGQAEVWWAGSYNTHIIYSI